MHADRRPVGVLGKPNVQHEAHALIYGARYDRMIEAFGGKGFFVEDLKGALEEG